MEGYLQERFGVNPQALENLSLWERGSTIHALSLTRGEVEPLASLRVVTVGLPLLRKVGRHLKPTSAALRLLSPWVTRNRLSLEPAQATELVQTGGIKLEHDLEEGYVLLETRGMALGCGLALPGRIKSQIPKRESRPLLCQGSPGALGSCRGPGPPHEPRPWDTTKS